MNYSDIISYLERIAIAHKDIKASYCGDYDRIYDVQSNTEAYDLPALWIESPEMTPVGTDDSIREQWSVSLVVLHKGYNQNTEKNKYEIEMSYRTATDVLYRLLKDESEDYLRISIINKTISPIDPYSADYLVGWRINLTFNVRATDRCYNSGRWDETIGVTQDLSFVIHRDDTDIIADNVVLPDGSGWTWTWTHNINNATSTTVPHTGALSINDASHNNIYIILSGYHAATGLVRQCSAFYKPGMTSIKSVPYLYNEYHQA